MSKGSWRECQRGAGGRRNHLGYRHGDFCNQRVAKEPVMRPPIPSGKAKEAAPPEPQVRLGNARHRNRSRARDHPPPIPSTHAHGVLGLTKNPRQGEMTWSELSRKRTQEVLEAASSEAIAQAERLGCSVLFPRGNLTALGLGGHGVCLNP